MMVAGLLGRFGVPSLGSLESGFGRLAEVPVLPVTVALLPSFGDGEGSSVKSSSIGRGLRA